MTRIFKHKIHHKANIVLCGNNIITDIVCQTGQEGLQMKLIKVKNKPELKFVNKLLLPAKVLLKILSLFEQATIQLATTNYSRGVVF